jgi:tetratricopeptide (TPR) repeat protein
MVSVWMLLGAIELDEGKATLGERHFRNAVECSERVEGPNGLYTAVARVGLARALAWQRKLKEAKAEIDVALEVEQKSLGPSREEIAEALLVSAEIAGLSKEYAAADRNFRDAIELYSALLPPDHPSLIVARSEYASFLKHKKK